MGSGVKPNGIKAEDEENSQNIGRKSRQKPNVCDTTRNMSYHQYIMYGCGTNERGGGIHTHTHMHTTYKRPQRHNGLTLEIHEYKTLKLTKRTKHTIL